MEKQGGGGNERKKKGKSGGVEKQGNDEEKKIEKEEGKEERSIFMRGVFSSALYSDGAALWRHLHLAEQALCPGGPSDTEQWRWARALPP